MGAKAGGQFQQPSYGGMGHYGGNTGWMGGQRQGAFPFPTPQYTPQGPQNGQRLGFGAGIQGPIAAPMGQPATNAPQYANTYNQLLARQQAGQQNPAYQAAIQSGQSFSGQQLNPLTVQQGRDFAASVQQMANDPNYMLDAATNTYVPRGAMQQSGPAQDMTLQAPRAIQPLQRMDEYNQALSPFYNMPAGFSLYGNRK